jgi:cell division protein FtsW
MRPSQPRQRRSVVEMMSRRRHKPDYLLVAISAALLIIGLIVVYAISPGLAAQKQVSDNYYVGKQLIAIVMGLAAFIVTSQMPLKTWQKLQWPLITIAAVSSVAVRAFGEQVNGAYRWIQVGGLSFQPVELIKLAIIIWGAGFLAQKIAQSRVDDFKQTLQPLLAVIVICTIVVAWMQSDLGSMGVIVAIVAAMLYVAGLPLKRVMMLGLVIIAGTALLIGTSAYRRDRFATYLNPEQDCLGSGYQTCQALIAVGSGGVAGKGLANSGQAFGYLPEAANDSIFAIMAEKFGFIGMSFVLVLFGAFFSRIKRILERAPDDYSRLMVAGILAWLSTQAFINIGAMLGLLPLKGITLPFISYGGTSVVFVTAAVGLLLNISRYTTYGISLEGGRSQRESSTDWRGNRRPYYAASSRR